MIKKFAFLFAVIIAFVLNESSFAQYVAPYDSVISAGVINTNVKLSNTKKYLLAGLVAVDNNSTLTIEKGTIIFGAPNGVGTIGGCLVIRRGSKIIADGTPDQPIVFTSSRPAGQRAAGDWGGLILLGKATNNQSLNVAIEGLTTEFHGGTDDSDNSGILRYVRIEFAGFELSPNNEVNSLTMGSVGSGTIIEHVQCSYGLDDAFEWFGGTVNAKYLVAYKTKDDDFDSDFGWRGKVQYGISWRDPQIADQSKSEAFESDNENAAGTPTPRTAPVYSNITAIGPKRAITDVAGTNFDVNYFHGVHQRRETRQNIFNSVIMGYNTHGIILDGTTVMEDMRDGNAKFSYNFVDGSQSVTTTGTVPSGFVAATWFTNSNNTVFSSALNQVNFKSPFNANAPGLNPLVGSPLIGAANFSDALLSGFDVVNYVGAFGPDGNTNWDRGWTNYDPQTTLYGFDVANNITDFTATIFLTNTNNETRQVVLGRHPNATDGLDASLGESNLPPLPPASVIDFRLEFPNPGITSVSDFRATGTISSPIIYTLKLQPGTTNGKLSWDPNLLGPGKWNLKVGTLININMKSVAQADIAADLAGATTVTVEVDPRFSFQTNIASNWNLISVPGLRPNMAPGAVFTTKDPAADAFAFKNGYLPVTELVPGEGYWLKSTANSNVNLANTESVVRIPYKGAAGWNLIGSYEYDADVNFIRTVPENKKSGLVYKYAPGQGYTPVDVLTDGFGYWINLTAAADIIIPGSYAPTLSKQENNLISGNWGKIVIKDAAGQNYTLYVAKESADLNMFNLPPVPPAGIFDVRFGSQRFVENLYSKDQTINLSGVVYPVEISVEGLDLRLEDAIDGSIINAVVKSGSTYQLADIKSNLLKVGSVEDVIPNEYSLEQNYPNPFNPTTTIKFSLPEASNVKLTVYNALGQKVAELVNSTLSAGSHSVNWDATNVSSGLYFYEISSNNFSAVKKMMLMK